MSGDVNLWRLSFSDESNLSDIESNDCKVLITHSDEVTDIKFSNDGTKIASCALDRFVYVCDVETGMILFKKEHPNCLICFSWCHDNGTLYVGDNTGFIYVWNMMTGEQNCSESIFNGPITNITSKMCTGSGRCKIIAAGVDKNEYLVKAFFNN